MRRKKRHLPISESSGVRWLIAAALVGIPGLGLLIGALIDFSQASKTAAWPSVSGVVERSEIKETSRTVGANTDIYYAADVIYHYSVGGTDYTGGRVYAGADSRSKEVALKRLAKYPAGKQIAVFYDPADPASAILENGIQPGNRIAIKTGLGMTALAVLFSYWFLQIRRREHAR